MTTQNDKRYIYENLRGGWSIASLSEAETGNYPSDLHAIEVASRDCSHVKQVDALTARQLSEHYGECAAIFHRTGQFSLCDRFHHWKQIFGLVADRLERIAASQISNPEISNPTHAITAAYAS